jgi:hypothetical protein
MLPRGLDGTPERTSREAGSVDDGTPADSVVGRRSLRTRLAKYGSEMTPVITGRTVVGRFLPSALVARAWLFDQEQSSGLAAAVFLRGSEMG